MIRRTKQANIRLDSIIRSIVTNNLVKRVSRTVFKMATPPESTKPRREIVRYYFLLGLPPRQRGIERSIRRHLPRSSDRVLAA